MASPKQRCPNCNGLTFRQQKTTPTEVGNHELENARVSYYKCSACGCYARLETPMSRLTVLKKGDVTEDMIRKVLTHLGLLEHFPSPPINKSVSSC